MADDFVKNILKEWGFETYITLFENEQINEEAFKLLDTDTIKDLFPKIGARLLFQKKHNILKLETTTSTICVNQENNTDTDSTVTYNNSESSVSSNIFIADDNINLDLRDIPISYVLPGPSGLQTLQTTSLETNKRKFDETFEEDSVFPGGLENILKKSITGQTLLNNKLCLTNDNRQKICNIGINELLSQTTNGKVPTESFEKAAKEIVQLFPNEIQDSYYMAYIPKTNKSPRILARGKLWSRYINAKRSLHSSKRRNLLERKENEASQEDNIDKEEEEETDELPDPYPNVLHISSNNCVYISTK